MQSRIIPAFLLIILVLLSCEKKIQTIDIYIKDVKFKVECAITKEEQQKGLMYRKKLDKQEGMLFVYDRYVRIPFWMKNTSIPLSIAFISDEGKILDIKDMKPFSQSPVYPQFSYMYALELNKGAFARINANVGDIVIFPEDLLKK